MSQAPGGRGESAFQIDGQRDDVASVLVDFNFDVANADLDDLHEKLEKILG